MKLFKNVDIQDLESILEKGILSLDESGNDNWEDRKRAENATDIVYLFSPLTEKNTFEQYGIALLECEIDDAQESAIREYDVNKNDYLEFTTERVAPENIVRIHIPAIFKDRVEKELTEDVMKKVEWCGFSANGFDSKEGCFVKISEEKLKMFIETTPLNTTCFNFFRGVNEKRNMIDLYNVVYEI